jgi:AcrR family transcriptional regulator
MIAPGLPPSPWRGKQGAEARESKRHAVIRAAARAFSRYGYHDASLDIIANALDVTKPTLYYYVKNKEQLLFECFRTGTDSIRTAFSELAGSQQTARERLIFVLLRYAESIASDYGWCMVRAEGIRLSADLQDQIKALKTEIDQGMRRLIREGIADGSIGRCDPKMTAFAVAGAMNWIAHWYHDNQALKPKEIAAAFVSFFENGLKPRYRA